MDWLLALVFGAPVVPPDYVGQVAAEASYSAMLQTTAPDEDDPRPVNPDCKTCNGTGRVRSGDGLGWSKCPECFPRAAVMENPVAPLPTGKFQTGAPVKNTYPNSQK